MNQSFRRMTKEDVPAPGDKWVTVTEGMSGYFAVIMWMNNEDAKYPFPEPWDTGYGRYQYRENAMMEAEEIAEMEGLPYTY